MRFKVSHGVGFLARRHEEDSKPSRPEQASDSGASVPEDCCTWPGLSCQGSTRPHSSLTSMGQGWKTQRAGLAWRPENNPQRTVSRGGDLGGKGTRRPQTVGLWSQACAQCQHTSQSSKKPDEDTRTSRDGSAPDGLGESSPHGGQESHTYVGHPRVAGRGGL